MSDEFGAERAFARAWLFEEALPLWADRGADRVHGGWHDKLDAGASPAPVPKRARVQGRQSFVFAQAGRLGWTGAWPDLVRHGIEFLRTAYLRPDGLYRTTVTPEGTPADDDYDLYDQAFVLLGLVSGYTSLGRPRDLLDDALALLRVLNTRLAHPLGGYEEQAPRRLPLRSNPHMHLLEALLAWVEAGGGAEFEAAARGLARLALDRFIDPATGAVGEYFDGDWQPMPGTPGGVREPGHQFEWAFLLGEAARVLGGDHAAASARLEAFGNRFGIDRKRQVAVFELDAAGHVTDPDARLWSQSERLRTSLILHRAASGGEAARLAEEARHAFAALRRFLEGPRPGLWRDRMKPDGRIVDEPAPASSLYHIVTGLLPLIDPAYARAPHAEA